MKEPAFLRLPGAGDGGGPAFVVGGGAPGGREATVGTKGGCNGKLFVAAVGVLGYPGGGGLLVEGGGVTGGRGDIMDGCGWARGGGLGVS